MPSVCSKQTYVPCLAVCDGGCKSTLHAHVNWSWLSAIAEHFMHDRGDYVIKRIEQYPLLILLYICLHLHYCHSCARAKTNIFKHRDCFYTQNRAVSNLLHEGTSIFECTSGDGWKNSLPGESLADASSSACMQHWRK